MTTIAFSKPIEDMIAGLSATGHVSHESHKKTTVTIHHNGGVRVSHQGVLDTWKTRAASAHFDVDVNGDIAQYVKVDEVAWSAGNWEGNLTDVSIEMADENSQYEISTATLNTATDLAAWLYVHVIGERPKASNFFMHSHWVQTDCPGPYVTTRFTTILSSVQLKFDKLTNTNSPAPTKKTVVQIAVEVINGKWGNGADRIARLKAAGYDPNTVQSEVNHELNASTPAKKSISVIATEVINGQWGNGSDRVSRLTKAGYNATAVQTEVNHRLS